METFDYFESYQPNNGPPRYASATLYRTEDRNFWTEGFHLWVMDDFGFLIHVGIRT